jgi:2-phospho-L-lactate guanylyltransferase (CobY/MobA/RfbA family)
MNKCAILIFARKSQSESNSKRIVASEKENIRLWNTLNSKTVKIVQKSNIPYFLADESVQIGINFGEKISNSIQTIFEQGFQKVIVIGNDCPALTSKNLKLAHIKLQQNDFVFGPDFKGGAYLLGISKDHFNALDFQGFNWQSNQLFSTLISVYKVKRIQILPFLNDVNDPFSFKSAVHNLNSKSTLKIALLDFLTFLNQFIGFIQKKVVSLKIVFLHYRGPPGAFASFAI